MGEGNVFEACVILSLGEGVYPSMHLNRVRGVYQARWGIYPSMWGCLLGGSAQGMWPSGMAFRWPSGLAFWCGLVLCPPPPPPQLPGDGHCRSRYASYWNAYVFLISKKKEIRSEVNDSSSRLKLTNMRYVNLSV